MHSQYKTIILIVKYLIMKGFLHYEKDGALRIYFPALPEFLFVQGIPL